MGETRVTIVVQVCSSQFELSFSRRQTDQRETEINTEGTKVRSVPVILLLEVTFPDHSR